MTTPEEPERDARALARTMMSAVYGDEALGELDETIVDTWSDGALAAVADGWSRNPRPATVSEPEPVGGDVREAVAEVIDQHAGARLANDNCEMVCDCGYVIWRVGVGFTDGPVSGEGALSIRAQRRHGADAILARFDVTPRDGDTVRVPRPVVPHGPAGRSENCATADYFREVVRKIDGGYADVGGSNVTATVRKLLLDTADALAAVDAANEEEA